MSFRTRKNLIIFVAVILICVAVFYFLNFDAFKKIKWESFDLKIGPASLKLPVLSSGAGGCGNGIVEEDLGEECDDGNFLSEDGCSPTCQWENVSIAYSWCGTTSCPVSRIYSQTGSAYSKQFWHIVPVAYVEIADIGNSTEVSRIKNIIDGQPKGFRAVINFFYPRWGDYIDTVGDKDNIIIPETCTNPSDLSTCQRIQDVPIPPGCSSPYVKVNGYAINYRSPWWGNWVTENQNRLRTFLNDYISMGGKEINYFLSDYEMGFDVGFAKPWPASLIPSGDTSDTPCNESLYYPAYNERVINWWNGIQNDPRFPAMASRLAQYGFVIPSGKTLYEYITPWTYEWTRPSTTNLQLMWNSVAWDMTAEYLNGAYYNVLKEYYSNIEMTDNENRLNNPNYPLKGNLHPYGPGVLVGTHQDAANFLNITFSTFKNGINNFRVAALAAPSVPFRVWLSHWSYGLQSPQNQTFNLNYAKYWTENVLQSLLTGSDGISWFNSSGDGEDQDTRTTADRTAESTTMNALLQEFDQLTFFRQDRQTLINNLISDSTNYVLTGMRVPNHYNLYRFTPNQDSGNTYQVLQQNPAIFLVNNTTRILIPNGQIYTPANNVAPYGYWITQPLGSANPIIETGTCVNTCVNETPNPEPEPEPGECTNDCIQGQSQCSDTSHRQICGQYDSDTCLEWSSAQVCTGDTSCGYGTCPDTHKPSWRCESGACSYVCDISTSCNGEQPTQPEQPDQPASQCTDDCQENQTKCFDTTHKQICGQYDSDSCLEWSDSQACTGSTSCGYGNCSETQEPSWSCKDGKCGCICQKTQKCNKTTYAYIKNYKTGCYNNNVYWYDSTGQIQDIYQECQDSFCNNGECVGYNPDEYCKSKSACGDNTCNCGEDALACPKDCSTGALSLNLFAKDQKTGEWQENPELTQSHDIEFLLVVANNTAEGMGEVVASVQLPEGMSYQGNLEIDGQLSPENIVFGMNIGFLEPYSEKEITFKAKADQTKEMFLITAKAESGDLQSAGSINLETSKLSEKQSLFGQLAQFISSHIILAVIASVIAYLLFAVGAYFVFNRII